MIDRHGVIIIIKWKLAYHLVRQDGSVCYTFNTRVSKQGHYAVTH